MEEVPQSQPLSSQRLNTGWTALTGPQAPTDIEEQIDNHDAVMRAKHGEDLTTLTRHEQELDPSVSQQGERHTEIDQLLQAYPNQLDMARADLDGGVLDQIGYDERISAPESFKAGLHEERHPLDCAAIDAQDLMLARTRPNWPMTPSPRTHWTRTKSRNPKSIYPHPSWTLTMATTSTSESLQ